MKKTILALAAALAATAHAYATETFAIDKNHSEATFKIRHFVSKVGGRFTDFDGTIQIADRAKPETASVEFTIKAASVDTANAQRDTHLKGADFFDVEKFPTITFKSSKIVAKGKDAYDVTGTLTMHGVSKEVTLPVTFLGFGKGMQGELAGFETAATLNRKDFGIVWNHAVDGGGLILGDDVAVAINVEADKKEAAAK